MSHHLLNPRGVKGFFLFPRFFLVFSVNSASSMFSALIFSNCIAPQ